MADLQVLEASIVSSVTVDASATTFLTGYLLANDASGNWVLADADVAARQDAQWICLESVSAGGSATYTMPVAKRIVAKDTDASAYTAGALLYMSATAGQHSGTAPTVAVGTVRRVVGKAVTANVIVLNIDVPHYYAHYSGGANAALANAFFFTAPRPLRVLQAVEVHDAAFAGSVTANIMKCASGTTIASGTAVLTTTFALDSTADTPVALAGHATAATARLATNDSLAISYSATTTGTGIAVTVALVDEQAI